MEILMTQITRNGPEINSGSVDLLRDVSTACREEFEELHGH
jgi:hypothetical protein